MEERFNIRSSNRVLKVYDDRVILVREGFINFDTERTVYYIDITSVEFEEAMGTLGRMIFSFAGNLPNDEDNIFTFGYPQNKEVLEAKAFIEEKIEEYKNQQNSETRAPSMSKAEELLGLKSLLDSGAINQEEFDMLKAEILAK